MMSPGEAGITIAKWAEHHRRDFSFRKTNDPFRLLVAEMLLRQTTARQVDMVYEGLFRAFPTADDLAMADLRKLRSIIRPLGIRSRVQQLRDLARMIQYEYGGDVPDSYDELTSFAGVGPYIAGVVLTFSFKKRYPLVDTNIERVLGRLVGISSVSTKHARIDEIYDSMSPFGQERDFHYGMLDIAAMYCRPKHSKCAGCPCTAFCAQVVTRK